MVDMSLESKVADQTKKKKKSDIRVDSVETDSAGEMIGREREKSGEDALVNKRSKKQRIDSETEDDGKKLKKKSKEKRVDSEPEDGVKKSKKKSNETMVDSEAEDGVKESKKKNKETKVDSEAEDGVKKKKKKKSKKKSGGDEIGDSERSKVCEKSLVGTDDANKKMGKRKRAARDMGAEENSEDKEMKRASKKKKPSVDSEDEENNKDFTKDANEKSKPSVASEVEENNKYSTKDAKKVKKKKVKQSVDSEVEENDLNSMKDSKKKRKQSEVSEVEENNLVSAKDAKKKSKKKKQSEDSEAEEKDLNAAKVTKKKRKDKKQSEDSEAEENNNDSTTEAKKKRKKKQECDKSDKDLATPSSKSTKRVKFSDQVEIFPAEDEESEEEAKLVRGKRYSKEEDELIKVSVLEYIDNHALGDEGIKMVMECKSHPQIKGCWKEIASAIPWRTYDSVYNRAHTLFEAGSRGVWTQEDLELVSEFQKTHGNDWRTLADAMGKHRKHVKDAWRRTRLASRKKGHWMREEYQALFDLVNKDLRMKAFQEKHSKHGMLRDNIPWMAISDKLGSRDHVTCCGKWYDQLQSPMIAKGIWANVDDYRLLEELLKLDAACIDDVDWDNLLDNRDGEVCRKRWNQMVLHIGSPRSQTFAEQVEILSDRYCPDLAEDREDFDNRPYDPED